MNNTQKGFSPVGIIIAILIVVIIATIGVVIFGKSDSSNSDQTKLKTYSDETFDYSFKYPGIFKVSNILSTNNVVHLQLEAGNKSPNIRISASRISYEKEAYNSVSSIFDGTHNRNKNIISEQTKFIIDGLPAVEYESRDGYISKVIQIDSSENTYSFAIDVSDGASAESIEMLRTIAKSFKHL